MQRQTAQPLAAGGRPGTALNPHLLSSFARCTTLHAEVGKGGVTVDKQMTEPGFELKVAWLNSPTVVSVQGDRLGDSGVLETNSGWLCMGLGLRAQGLPANTPAPLAPKCQGSKTPDCLPLVSSGIPIFYIQGEPCPQTALSPRGRLGDHST